MHRKFHRAGPEIRLVAACIAGILSAASGVYAWQTGPGPQERLDVWLQQATEEAQRLAAPIQAARARQDRQLEISRHLANYERSGHYAHIGALAWMSLTDDEALSVYAPLLAHRDSQVRRSGLFGLSRHGPASALALGAVLRFLPEEDCLVSRDAAITIAAIGPAAAPAVGPLLDQLQQSKDRLAPGNGILELRREITIAFGRIGSPAAAALPALHEELANVDSSSAFEAYQAIGRIKNLSPAPTSRPEDLLSVDSFHMFQFFQNQPPPQPSAVNVITAALRQSPDVPELVMGLKTLAALAPADRETIAIVLRHVASPDAFIMELASTALQGAQMVNPDTRQLLIAALLSENQRLMIEAAKALSRFGKNAAPSVPTVMQVIERCAGLDGFQRMEPLLNVLRAVGRDASAATPLLISMLREDSQVYRGLPSLYAELIRKYILITLADIGITTDAIPAIVDMLSNHWTPDMVAAGARAAGALPAGHWTVAPFLIKVLEDRRMSMGTTLDIMGMKFLQLGEPLTSPRLEAIRSFRNWGGAAAKTAIPTLERLAHEPPHPSPFVPAFQQEAGAAKEALAR